MRNLQAVKVINQEDIYQLCCSFSLFTYGVMRKKSLYCLFVLFCGCAGGPAAEVVHTRGVDTADEARAAASQHG